MSFYGTRNADGTYGAAKLSLDAMRLLFAICSAKAPPSPQTLAAALGFTAKYAAALCATLVQEGLIEMEGARNEHNL